MSFFWVEKGLTESRRCLDIGYAGIAKQHFKNALISEAEIEYAINQIEDALMSDRGLLNRGNSRLYCDDPALMKLLGATTKGVEFSRRHVEEVFNDYAFKAMGRLPVGDGVRADKAVFARLLLLREVMHHLGFQTLCIVRE